MKTKRAKWIFYTLLVGVIPMVSRFLLWLVTENGTIELLQPGDFVAFGLVLHISNINEIEHMTLENGAWKTAQNGISAFFIALYSVLYVTTLLSDNIQSFNKQSISISAIIFNVVSLLLSFSVFYRIGLHEPEVSQ